MAGLHQDTLLRTQACVPMYQMPQRAASETAPSCAMQALKANPHNVPTEFKVNNNYLQTFGQTALVDALDMVADVSGSQDFRIVL